MTSARTTITTTTEGSGPGNRFDDGPSLVNLNTAIVTRIVMTVSGEFLRSIAVHYADSVGVAHGHTVGENAELTLQKYEFITTVEGACSNNVISKIAFETSEGRRWGPYGQVREPNTFVWGKFGPGMGFLYFDGTASSHIITLRANFAKYQTPHTSPARPAMIKYEKHITTGSHTPPLSHFATNLMSPTVTLLIGPDSVVFQTSQDILCRLQFFRAALQGGFVESSAHTINMPEDEPQTIAALIEFLYTGNYSYPYHTTSNVEMDGAEEAMAPAVELAEGEYHVSVYATAHRYGCTNLENAALQGFMFVLGQLKGVDVLHLWRSAYTHDLDLREVENEVELAEFRSGLPRLLKELFMLHPADMKRTSEDLPTLVHDLLRLVVCKE